jgi:hypothetical protein
VDDITIRLEHVDLLNVLDGLSVQLLESSLELLVVHSTVLMNLLDLATGSTLSTISVVSEMFLAAVYRVFSRSRSRSNPSNQCC